MGLFGKAFRYSVPKVSVNRSGIRFGNHFGGVSSSWSGRPRADFGIGPARARFGPGPYQGGRISSSGPGVSPSQEYVDLSGTRAPVIPSRDRNERPGFKSLKKHGVIGLFPQTFHQHVPTLFVYGGLFSSFLLAVFTRYSSQQYQKQNELWMDGEISSFLPNILAFLCFGFFVLSLAAYLLSHLPIFADAESVKWKKVTHSGVLTFIDISVFFSVFTKPNISQILFNISGDAWEFRKLFILPISAICVFKTMQSLVHSLEPKGKSEIREARNQIVIQRNQQIEADLNQARQAAWRFIREPNNQHKGGRIFELNQQLAFAFNDRTARRIMRKTEWMEMQVGSHSTFQKSTLINSGKTSRKENRVAQTPKWKVARVSAKAQFEEAAKALAEATQAIFLEYPEISATQTTIDSSRMDALELDLRGTFSNTRTYLSKCRGVLSDKQIGHHQSELLKLRWELEDRFGFKDL